jgi:hypothetical protein
MVKAKKKRGGWHLGATPVKKLDRWPRKDGLANVRFPDGTEKLVLVSDLTQYAVLK